MLDTLIVSSIFIPLLETENDELVFSVFGLNSAFSSLPLVSYEFNGFWWFCGFG